MKSKAHYFNAIAVAIYTLLPKVKLNTARKFLENMMQYNSISIPEEVIEDKDILVKINEAFIEGTNLFTDQEKKLIIDNYLREIYSKAYNNDRAWDNTLSYVKRQEHHLMSIKNEAKVILLSKYIRDNKNIKNEYENFSKDLFACSSHYKTISIIADDIQINGYKNELKEVLKKAIAERKRNAKELYNKYGKLFSFTEVDLSSIVESEMFFNRNISNNKEELKLVS